MPYAADFTHAAGHASRCAGSLLGAPADGKSVRWNAVDIYRITNGKISEEWAANDVAAIMAQIGAFNPPWAA